MGRLIPARITGSGPDIAGGQVWQWIERHTGVETANGTRDMVQRDWACAVPFPSQFHPTVVSRIQVLIKRGTTFEILEAAVRFADDGGHMGAWSGADLYACSPALVAIGTRLGEIPRSTPCAANRASALRSFDAGQVDLLWNDAGAAAAHFTAVEGCGDPGLRADAAILSARAALAGQGVDPALACYRRAVRMARADEQEDAEIEAVARGLTLAWRHGREMAARSFLAAVVDVPRGPGYMGAPSDLERRLIWLDERLRSGTREISLSDTDHEARTRWLHGELTRIALCGIHSLN